MELTLDNVDANHLPIPVGEVIDCPLTPDVSAVMIVELDDGVYDHGLHVIVAKRSGEALNIPVTRGDVVDMEAEHDYHSAYGSPIGSIGDHIANVLLD